MLLKEGFAVFLLSQAFELTFAFGGFPGKPVGMVMPGQQGLFGSGIKSSGMLKQSVLQKENQAVQVNQGAGMPDPCATIKCKHYATCKVDPTVNEPQCKCPICKNDNRPVCGSDGKTYGNECKLKHKVCKTEDDNLTKRKDGSCETKCPELIIANGKVTGKRTIGEKVTITCNTGYKISGSTTRTCQGRGQWDGTAATCEQIPCPQYTVSNGQVTGLRTVGQQVKVKCNSGYKISGSRSRTCQSNGQWDGTEATCQQIKCPQYTVANGQVTGQRTVGQKVTVKCNSGYKISGSQSRTCQSNGQWDGTEATCQQIKCPQYTVSNGQVTGQRTVGQQVTVKCNSGYKISGSQSRNCQSNGQWDGTEAACQQILCPAITIPGSALSTSERKVGTQLTITCNSGYTRIGNGKKKCGANGQWEGSDTKCAKHVCAEAPKIANTHLRYNGGKIEGTKAFYLCNNMHKRQSGDCERVCQKDGSWSGKPLVCTGGTQGSQIPITNTFVSSTQYGWWPPRVFKNDNLCFRSKMGLSGDHWFAINLRGIYTVGSVTLKGVDVPRFDIIVSTATFTSKIFPKPLAKTMGVCYSGGSSTRNVVNYQCTKTYMGQFVYIVARSPPKKYFDLCYVAVYPKAGYCVLPLVDEAKIHPVRHDKPIKAGDKVIYYCDPDTTYSRPKEIKTCLCSGELSGLPYKCRNRNVAYRRPYCKHSSYWGSAIPTLALDGNTDGNFGSRSCTATQPYHATAWWYVDLQREFKISSVAVFNREDCCNERSTNVAVYVYDSASDVTRTGKGRLCNRMKGELMQGEKRLFKCPNNMVGRVVSVKFERSRKEYMTLCEVRVYERMESGLRPVIRGLKNTFVVDSWSGYWPTRAIDRNDLTCFRTANNRRRLNPWFALNLNGYHAVGRVDVVGVDTVTNLRVMVSMNPLGAVGDFPSPYPAGMGVCHHYVGTSLSSKWQHFHCKKTYMGRYVFIVVNKPARGYLRLCQIEVRPRAGYCPIPLMNLVKFNPPLQHDKPIKIGEKVTLSCDQERSNTKTTEEKTCLPSELLSGKPFTCNDLDLAYRKPTISGPWAGYKAVDGNTDGNYGGRSCTHTGNVLNPWWRVDLQKYHNINLVTVYNREDCCYERSMNVHVFVKRSHPRTVNQGWGSTSLSADLCSKMTGTMKAGEARKFQCTKPLQGRYVYVVFDTKGRSSPMTLCEVRVYEKP